MSYRKITVDGKEYQYVIGRSHVKIAGVGVWPHKEVAQTIIVESEICEWTGLVLDTYERLENVTPADIARKIRANT